MQRNLQTRRRDALIDFRKDTFLGVVATNSLPVSTKDEISRLVVKDHLKYFLLPYSSTSLGHSLPSRKQTMCLRAVSQSDGTPDQLSRGEVRGSAGSGAWERCVKLEHLRLLPGKRRLSLELPGLPPQTYRRMGSS